METGKDLGTGGNAPVYNEAADEGVPGNEPKEGHANANELELPTGTEKSRKMGKQPKPHGKPPTHPKNAAYRQLQHGDKPPPLQPEGDWHRGRNLGWDTTVRDTWQPQHIRQPPSKLRKSN